MTSAPRKRVAVFISGGGSNMLALAKACEAADFPAEIVAVLSDKPEAGGLAKAEALGIPALAFERRAYGSKAEHEAAILAALAEIKPDIICLAGYMRLVSADFIRPYRIFPACIRTSGRWTPAMRRPAAPCISSQKAWTKAPSSCK